MTGRGGRMAGAYVLAAALWAAFAAGLAPALLADAYHGRSGVPVLNRLLAATSRRPLAHYLGLWRDLAVAVAIAMGAHAVVVAAVRARFAEGRWRLGLAAWAAAVLGLTVLAGPRQDYAAYLEIWARTRAGGDPWAVHPEWGYSLNAYGPAFLFLAPVAGLNPLAPKLLFATAFLLAAVALLAALCSDPRLRGGPLRFWLLALVASPFAWVEIAWYGHFDLVVALSCVAALHGADRDRDAAAGAWLGAGVLLKYLPVVIGPALALRRDGTIRRRLVIAAAVVVAAGLAGAWAAWGPAPLRALQFGATRGSTSLSVFRFLRGLYSPLWLLWPDPDLDSWALPALALGGAVVVGLAAWRRLEPARAATAAVLVTVLLYRVGFPQYQTVVFTLAALACLRDPSAWSSGRLREAFGLYFAWISAFTLFDWAVDGVIANPQWGWVEDLAGAPTAVLGAWLLAALLRAEPPTSR